MNKMSKTLRYVIIGAAVLLFMKIFFVGYNRIDAGYTGIKVNLYGSDKGVDDVTEVTGAVWRFKPTTKIYEFPNFVQNVVWTASEDEGSLTNDEFRLTTIDGMLITIDVSANYRVERSNAVSIFKKYRKPLNEISNTVLRNYIRSSFNDAASMFTAEETYSKRKEFLIAATKEARSTLEKEGFTIEKIVLLNDIRLPNSVMYAIESKVKAKQLALQKHQELQQAKADAEKRIAKAEGIAKSKRIHADADRYAYEQKQKSLTPLLVQQQFVDKWDGKLPVYGQVPQLFRTISK